MPAWLLPHRCGSFGNPPASTPPLFASNRGTGFPTRWISTAKCPNDPKYNAPHHKKRGKVGGLWRSELGQKDNNVYICRTRRAKLTRFARRVPSFGATAAQRRRKTPLLFKKTPPIFANTPLVFLVTCRTFRSGTARSAVPAATRSEEAPIYRLDGRRLSPGATRPAGILLQGGRKIMGHRP